MSDEKRPPHPATVPVERAPHRATVQRREAPFGMPRAPPPHPATVVQRREAPFGMPKVPPPHPATVVQRREAPFGAPKARPPHPARVVQPRAAIQMAAVPGQEHEAIRQFGILVRDDISGEHLDLAKRWLDYAQDERWEELEDVLLRYVRSAEDERDFGFREDKEERSPTLAPVRAQGVAHRPDLTATANDAKHEAASFGSLIDGDWKGMELTMGRAFGGSHGDPDPGRQSVALGSNGNLCTFYGEADKEYKELKEVPDKVYWLPWKKGRTTSVSFADLKDYNAFLTSPLGGCMMVITKTHLFHVAQGQYDHFDDDVPSTIKGAPNNFPANLTEENSVTWSTTKFPQGYGRGNGAGYSVFFGKRQSDGKWRFYYFARGCPTTRGHLDLPA